VNEYRMPSDESLDGEVRDDLEPDFDDLIAG
jgi:hypothetical protein